MPAAVDQCPRMHDTSNPAARDSQGHCKTCRSEDSRRKRVSDGMKLAIVKAFEDVGVEFVDDDGNPVAPVEVVRQLVATYEDYLDASPAG